MTNTVIKLIDSDRVEELIQSLKLEASDIRRKVTDATSDGCKQIGIDIKDAEYLEESIDNTISFLQKLRIYNNG